jgi:hypothetical protein
MSKANSKLSLIAGVLLVGMLLAGPPLVARTAAGGMEREVKPPEVRDFLQGMYEIRRSGRDVGSETFIRRVLSGNTVVIESTYDVVAEDGTFIMGNNRLEYEEDSGFPRSYYALRKTRSENSERVRESTANMFANVVVWDNREGDHDIHELMELPTGCFFIEANIANQVAVVIDRYKSSRGGKQTYDAFDPLAGGRATVAVEYVGEVAPNGDIELVEGQTLEHYRYHAGEMSEADVFVKADGLVVKIDVRTHDLQYILVSIDTQADADSGQR